MMETRQMVCDGCAGDGGWHRPVDFNHVNGSLIEHWQKCTACDGKGEVEIELEPITLEDLAQD